MQSHLTAVRLIAAALVIFVAGALGPADRANADVADAAGPVLRIEPAEFVIVGPYNLQRLLVSDVVAAGAVAEAGDERPVDFSRQAVYASSDASVVVVSADGVVRPVGNGTAEVTATLGGATATARVAVKRFVDVAPVSFANEVVPLLTKLGCNSGGCHGKAAGQNGFKLSLLGYAPEADHAAIVRQSRGRRVCFAAPEESLLLRKATGSVPHGGGARLSEQSPAYESLLRWLRQGAPAGNADEPTIVRIECWPKTCVLTVAQEQQLLVTACYSDGTRRDVTHETQFRGNEDQIARVDTEGRVTALDRTGATPIMARYMGLIDVCRITIPRSTDPDAVSLPWPQLVERNYIDRHVQAKWRELKLVPSPLADDATFLRRAFIDAIGTLPTPAEVREFLSDRDPDKRAEWVDRILSRHEYADFWAVKWGDLLRNKRRGGDPAKYGTFLFHDWIRTALAGNMPYDEFVSSIITATGTVSENPAVIWFREVRNFELTNNVSQLFLGMRLNCAQCHHHPYEKWGQDDYYRLQAFFTRIGTKNGADSPSILIRATKRDKNDKNELRHPATGAVMKPAVLDGPELTIDPGEDPRQRLADWMVSPDNPYLAKAISNRLWAHFLGQGLVEPLDDMRVTNPPSNPDLLRAMAEDLVAHGFDLKHLMRTILVSSTYQLSAEPNEVNRHDRQNYARSYPRRLSAEVLVDGVNQITETSEEFEGLPAGMRAIELPDESVASYFLDVFGRPRRDSPCDCERSRDANLAQSLQLFNSADIQRKVAHEQGRLGRLTREGQSDEQIMDDLYLAAFARLPRADERAAATRYIVRRADRLAGLQDLLWVILNTKEFAFNH